jgi:hypothetical protein
VVVSSFPLPSRTSCSSPVGHWGQKGKSTYRIHARRTVQRRGARSICRERRYINIARYIGAQHTRLSSPPGCAVGSRVVWQCAVEWRKRFRHRERGVDAQVREEKALIRRCSADGRAGQEGPGLKLALVYKKNVQRKRAQTEVSPKKNCGQLGGDVKSGRLLSSFPEARCSQLVSTKQFPTSVQWTSWRSDAAGVSPSICHVIRRFKARGKTYVSRRTRLDYPLEP